VYNRDGVCLLCGTEWLFKTNYINFVCLKWLHLFAVCVSPDRCRVNMPLQNSPATQLLSIATLRCSLHLREGTAPLRHFATSPRHFLSKFRPYRTKFITVTLSRDTVTNSEPIQSHAMRYWNSPIKGISRQSCSPSPHSFCFIVALTIKLQCSCLLQQRHKSNPTPQHTSYIICTEGRV
jgi:hypothetical protein